MQSLRTFTRVSACIRMKLVRTYHRPMKIYNLIKENYYSDLIPVNSEKYLLQLEQSKKFSVYMGIDPSSDSLQLGNLVALVGLLRCHLSGKDIITIVGGCTGLLGDPSGKTSKRIMQPEDLCSSNTETLKENLVKIFTNYQNNILPKFEIKEPPGSIEIYNNYDWLSRVDALSFLRDTTPFFRIPELLDKESVKLRLDSKHGLDLQEFLYPILQAMDFQHLYQHHNCHMQIGGQDQLGNITCGMNLIYRRLNQHTFGLTVPLLTTPDGKKLGKSEMQSETIWLSGAKLLPYHFYQRILNLSDSLISEKLIRQLTFFSSDEIQQLLVEHKDKPDRRVVQKALAEELTLLIHGAEALQASQLTTRIFFPHSNVTQSTSNNRNTSLQVIADLQSHELDFLLSCLSGQSHTIPVLHLSEKSFASVDRFFDLVSLVTQSSIQETSSLHSRFAKGVTLNDVPIIRPGKSPIPTKLDDFKTEIYANLIEEAFNRFDQRTGLGVLRLGKHELWLVTTDNRNREKHVSTQ